MGRNAMIRNCLFFVLALTLWPVPAAAEQIGVVLMHGKQSAPGQHGSLAGAMADAGFATDVPEMCWSFRRIYDRPYGDCLREIDDAIARLKRKGATAFVVAGHSLGANGALGYGAMNKGLKGVIALAPGHRPEILSRRAEVADSLEHARKLVAAGRGERLHLASPISTAVFSDHGCHDTERLSELPRARLARGHAQQRGAPDRAAALRRGDRRSAATWPGRNLRQGAAASAQSVCDRSRRPLRYIRRVSVGGDRVAQGDRKND